jgi:hypothetical protein
MKKVIATFLTLAIVYGLMGCAALTDFKSIAEQVKEEGGTEYSETLEKDIINYYFVSASSDGSSLTVNGGSYNIPETTAAVKAVNKKLGLPDSLLERMKGTRALDGAQTVTEKGITITWTYHPDDGLHVVYTK